MNDVSVVKALAIALAALAAVCSTVAPCSGRSNGNGSAGHHLSVAAAFIDYFYSFDSDRLHAAMENATPSMPDILYYQRWAKAGHYVVLARKPCRFDKADEVSCGVTVKDDLAPALHINYHVTDTFHFAFRHRRIVKVWNSSDDPPEFHEAMEWLRDTHPQVFTGPCLGIWKGGPTPEDCVRAVVKGFEGFTAIKGRVER